jgi:RimJ/RimL family protein N-acetyltransferase
MILETTRLSVSELSLDDSLFILELLNTPDWLTYIGERNVKSPEQAKVYLENGPLKSYSQHGFGLWLVKRNQDKACLGICGLLKRDYLSHPDIGFAFLPKYTGQGYALESATAVLHYAKNKLELSTIFAIVMAENRRSIQLLEKIGMAFKNPILLPSAEELLLYG